MSRQANELDEKQRRAIETILLAYRDQIRANIEVVLRTHVPSIDSQSIIGVLKHSGAGGTTYILQAEFVTGSRTIQGGIVVKFANELEEDVRNATELMKILKAREVEWRSNPPQKPLPDWMPPSVFSPKVLGTHPSRKVIILEFVGGGIPLLKIDWSNEKKYKALGYALGRLHGTTAYPTAMVLYEPMFRLLEAYMPSHTECLQFWKRVIANSRGGCEFIHGDSHLENLMYSSTSNALAWIDALLVPRGDRMDDVTYAISHIIQEDVIHMLTENPNTSSKVILSTVLRNAAQSIVPHVLSTYMRTANLKGLYDTVIPVDFFLGSHLIIRSQLFGNSKVANILTTMGTEFITERPLGKLLGLERS